MRPADAEGADEPLLLSQQSSAQDFGGRMMSPVPGAAAAPPAPAAALPAPAAAPPQLAQPALLSAPAAAPDPQAAAAPLAAPAPALAYALPQQAYQPQARMPWRMPRPAFLGARHDPPPGCAPDAIKIFVGNIPKHYTEQQLRPFFETVGPVVELVILRDKVTQESKGGAFLWYTNLQHADMAMARFNLSHVLPDPTGQMTRPLVVRPANLRPGAPVAGGRLRPRPLGYSPQQVGYGAQLGFFEGQAHQQQYQQQADQQQYQQQAAAYGGIPDLQPQQQYMQQFQQQQFQQQQNLQQQFQQQQFQPQQYAGEGQQEQQHQLHHEPLQQPGMYLQTPPAASLPGLQPVALAPAQAALQPFQQMMAAAPGYQLAPQQVAPQQLQPTVTLSVQLSTQQMASISEHLYSVQTMSGAQLSSAPLARGITALHVSGTEQQVEHAKQMMVGLLGGGS